MLPTPIYQPRALAWRGQRKIQISISPGKNIMFCKSEGQMELDQTNLLKRIHYLLRNIELLLGLILIALIVLGVHFWRTSS
jgi:hypothetical protein